MITDHLLIRGEYVFAVLECDFKLATNGLALFGDFGPVLLLRALPFLAGMMQSSRFPLDELAALAELGFLGR